MSKISAYKSIVLIIILILPVLSLPREVFAASICNSTFDPPHPNTYMDKLTVTVDGSSLSKDRQYLMIVQDPNDYAAYTWTRNDPPSLSFTFEGISGLAFGSTRGWQERNYQIYVFTGDTIYSPGGFGVSLLGGTGVGNALCTGSFPVILKPIQDQCTAQITTKPIAPNTEINLAIDNITPGTYKIKVEALTGTPSGNGRDYDNNQINNTSTNLNLTTFNQGSYRVLILKDDKVQCRPSGFEVGATGKNAGGQIDLTSSVVDKCKDLNNRACSKAGGEPCDNDTGFKTAIGCIHTTPKALVEDVLKFATGIGGGLAFMMMLLGAFQMLTSGGNPQNLQGGRDTFQNAIIGLLFIIFSILLMKIIGIDILNIPGFS